MTFIFLIFFLYLTALSPFAWFQVVKKQLVVLLNIHLSEPSCILIFHGSNEPNTKLLREQMLRRRPIHTWPLNANWTTIPPSLMFTKGFTRKLLPFMLSLVCIVWSGTTKACCKFPVRKQNVIFLSGISFFTMNQSLSMIVSFILLIGSCCT